MFLQRFVKTSADSSVSSKTGTDTRQICKFVDDYGTLAVLMRVSKLFKRLAGPKLYSSVPVKLCGENTHCRVSKPFIDAARLAELGQSSLAPFIKSIDFYASYSLDPTGHLGRSLITDIEKFQTENDRFEVLERLNLEELWPEKFTLAGLHNLQFAIIRSQPICRLDRRGSYWRTMMEDLGLWSLYLSTCPQALKGIGVLKHHPGFLPGDQDEDTPEPSVHWLATFENTDDRVNSLLDVLTGDSMLKHEKIWGQPSWEQNALRISVSGGLCTSPWKVPRLYTDPTSNYEDYDGVRNWMFFESEDRDWAGELLKLHRPLISPCTVFYLNGMTVDADDLCHVLVGAGANLVTLRLESVELGAGAWREVLDCATASCPRLMNVFIRDATTPEVPIDLVEAGKLQVFPFVNLTKRKSPSTHSKLDFVEVGRLVSVEMAPLTKYQEGTYNRITAAYFRQDDLGSLRRLLTQVLENRKVWYEKYRDPSRAKGFRGCKEVWFREIERLKPGKTWRRGRNS